MRSTPDGIAKNLGAEIIRLWVASVEYREDSRSSDELMGRIADNYRKLRNTLRYVLANISDFDPQQHAVPFAEMEFVDQAMLLQTAELNATAQRWYDERLFSRVYQSVSEFCVVTLSAVYFDLLKDRLYTSAPRSKARRSAQTAVWMIGEALVRLLAPIMSFTCDEAWQYLPKTSEREASVHLARFWNEELTANLTETGKAKIAADWEQVLTARDAVLLALETERKAKAIGSGLEAQVTLHAGDAIYATLSRHAAALREIFIVSGVKLEKSPSLATDAVEVKVSSAAGEKCERCWTYSIHVGEDAKYPTVCDRCSAALQEIDETQAAGRMARAILDDHDTFVT